MSWRIIAPLCVLFLSSLASAQVEPDMLGIQPRNHVQIGGKRPALVLHPGVDVKRVSVVLTAGKGGSKVRLKSGRIRRGSAKELSWKQAVGTKHWSAEFDVTLAHGARGKFTITFDSTVYPKIASTLSKTDVNLEDRYLVLRLNQPADHVDIVVWADTGEQIFEGSESFDGVAAGSPLRVPWDQPTGVGVLKIVVRAFSVFGFWVGTEVTPFEIEIPHEEVEFEFGKWDIRSTEAHKLDNTLKLLSEKLKRFGGLVKLQLYVAGYTDTVGSRSSNQELSEKRARSIAVYFRKKGLPIPVFHQGFGEDALAVKTPDETREARNRRALYVLSASAPAKQSAMPRSNWRR